MNAFFLTLLLWSQVVGPPGIADPPYPADAFRGGTLVALVEFHPESENRISLLHSEAPFEKPVREALSQWQFHSGSTSKSAIIVFNFRDFIVPMSRSIACSQPDWSLPVPNFVVDPIYPETTLRFAGAVTARLGISVQGKVQAVEIMKGIDEFNQSVTDALLQWKFKPALNKLGKPIDSEAYAVCIYRPLQTRQD